jgi:nucleotide-binding universal stress UspA family protein
MIKRILAATDGSEAAQRGVDYAISLAKALDARLTGIFVVDIKLLEGPFLRELAASMGTAPMLSYQDTMVEVLDERGRKILAAFKERAAEAGVQAETVMLTGVVHHAILEAAAMVDLVVLGHGGEHADWLEGLMGSTTEAVLRRAKLPVAVAGCTRPLSEGMVLAFDGSPHACQALRTAIALAQETGAPLRVLVLGGEDMEAAAQDARSYLSDHKLDAPVERLLAGADVAAKIVEYAREAGAGMLVMGAYGHSRVRELFIGSTTMDVVNHAACPVLLCR